MKLSVGLLSGIAVLAFVLSLAGRASVASRAGQDLEARVNELEVSVVRIGNALDKLSQRVDGLTGSSETPGATEALQGRVGALETELRAIKERLERFYSSRTQVGAGGKGKGSEPSVRVSPPRKPGPKVGQAPPKKPGSASKRPKDG